MRNAVKREMAPDVHATKAQLAPTRRSRACPIGVKFGAGVDSGEVCAAIDALITLGDAGAASGNCRTACSKGCSYCCHMRAVVTAPEVLRIAAFIEETFSAEEREALARRVAATDEQARGMSDEAWGEARVPCPLLVASECSVYSVRPLDCRAYNSCSVASCRDAFEAYADWDVPVDAEHQSYYKSLQAGLLQALAGSGGRIASRAHRSTAHSIRGPECRWSGGAPERTFLPLPSWTLTIPNSRPFCHGRPPIPCAVQRSDAINLRRPGDRGLKATCMAMAPMAVGPYGGGKLVQIQDHVFESWRHQKELQCIGNLVATFFPIRAHVVKVRYSFTAYFSELIRRNCVEVIEVKNLVTYASSVSCSLTCVNPRLRREAYFGHIPRRTSTPNSPAIKQSVLGQPSGQSTLRSLSPLL